MVVPHSRADPYALLTRPPLPTTRRWLLARLACVRPAASVRSEPGSNSHVTVRTRHTSKEAYPIRHKSRPSILKLASDARTKAYQSTKRPITPTAHPFLKNTLCQKTRQPGQGRYHYSNCWRDRTLSYDHENYSNDATAAIQCLIFIKRKIRYNKPSSRSSAAISGGKSSSPCRLG